MGEVDFLWKLAAFLITAGAVYGGIRGDLKSIHERLAEHKDGIAELNKRLNDCMLCDRRKNAGG